MYFDSLNDSTVEQLVVPNCSNYQGSTVILVLCVISNYTVGNVVIELADQDAHVSSDIENIHVPKWNGYKLVGDNLDKNIVPRYKRVDRQTESLHFFHYYAVKDRVDLSGISDEPNTFLLQPVSKLPINTILPSTSDLQAMLYNFSILISRILVEELPYFAMTFEGVVTKHIQHCYSDDMAKKSETVS